MERKHIVEIGHFLYILVYLNERCHAHIVTNFRVHATVRGTLYSPTAHWSYGPIVLQG